MDIEFHYYITYMLAEKAGFNKEDTYKIAYSSQYVDDNSRMYKVRGDTVYENYISQTMNILKPKSKLMQIYPCFHFIPGEHETEEAKRKDGNMHILNTTPNSIRANKLIDDALAGGNPYSVGIATHSYADTWAHQNFVGCFDFFNALGGALEALTPNVGHADAQYSPDIPGLVWKDERLVSDNKIVNNKHRFVRAAENIFKKYKRHNDKNAEDSQIESDWQEIKTDIENAIGVGFKHDRKKEQKKRIARYKKLIENFKNYDEDSWLDKAVRRKVVGAPDDFGGDMLESITLFPDKYYKKSGFENSHWYNFQECVKKHQKEAKKLFADLFKQMEIDWKS